MKDGAGAAGFSRNVPVSRPQLAPDAMRRFVASAWSRFFERHPKDFWFHQKRACVEVARRVADLSVPPTAWVVIPTGGGKTRIFQALVDALREYGAPDRVMPRVIMLVPTLPLIGQTLDAFAAFFPGNDIGHLASRAVLSSGGEPYEPGARSVTLMTYTRFTAMVADGALSPADVDVIVMDEAHRGLSDLRVEAMAPFLGNTVVTAFTATPEFDQDKSLARVLDAGPATYTVPPQELRDAGVIAPIVNYVLAVRLYGTRSDDAAPVLVRRKAFVDNVLDFIETHVDDTLGVPLLDKTCMFFGTDRAHARIFADEYNRRFSDRGLRMEVLSGYDSPERIRKTIDDLRRGEITGIANAQLLIEGCDVRKIGLVVNAPTGSVVKNVQQSGRAQRIDDALEPDDRNQTAVILDGYYEVNGRVLGHPRWFFEASGDTPVVREAIRKARRLADVDVSRYASDEAYLADASEDAEADAEFEAGPAEGCDPVDTAQGSPDDFEISAGIAAVRYLLRRRDKKIYPHNPEDWIARSNLLAEGLNFARTTAFFASVDAEVQERDRDSPGAIFDVVREGCVFQARIARTGNILSVVYRRSDIALFKRMFDVPVEPLSEHWLSKVDIVRGPLHQAGHEFFAGLEAEFLAKRRAGSLGSEPIVRSWTNGERTSEPVRIRMELCRTTGSTPVITYHEDCLDDMLRLAGLPMPGLPKTEEWLTREEIKRVRGFAIEGALVELTTLFEIEERLDPRTDRVTCRGETVRMRRIDTSPKPVAFHRDDVEAVLRLSGRPQRAAGHEIPLTHVAKRIGVYHGEARLLAVFEELARQIAAGEPPSILGTPVRAAIRLSGAKDVVCIDEDDIPVVERALFPDGAATRKTAEWMSRDAVGKAIGKSPQTSVFVEIWEQLQAAPVVDGFREVGGARLRAGAFRTGRIGKPLSFRLHRDDVDAFGAVVAAAEAERPPGRRTAAGTRSATRKPKTEHASPVESVSAEARKSHWLNKTEASKRLRVVVLHPDFHRVWQEIEGQVRCGEAAKVGGKAMRAGLIRIGPRGAVRFCLHVDALPALAEAIGKPLREVSIRTAADLTCGEVCARLRTTPHNPKFRTAWARLEADALAGVVRPGIRARWCRTTSRSALCLHADDLSAFAASADIEFDVKDKTPGWLTAGELAAAVGKSVRSAAFRDVWQALVGSRSGKTAEMDGETFEMPVLMSGAQATPCVHERDVSRLAQIFAKQAVD